MEATGLVARRHSTAKGGCYENKDQREGWHAADESIVGYMASPRRSVGAPNIRQTPKSPSKGGFSFPTLDGFLQLRVLGFGLLQDGDVGVGVFPEGKEIFVR